MEKHYEILLKELRSIKFPKRNPKKEKTRTKILGKNELIQAFIIGKARAYHQKELVNCSHNRKFPHLLELCANAIKEFDPEFSWTTIQVNKDVLCNKHTDNNNVGLSIALGLGNFEGGGIIQYNLDGSETFIDTKNKFSYQDGCIPHKTADFKGERYSLIFYYHKCGFHTEGNPQLPEILAHKMKHLDIKELSVTQRTINTPVT
jgi:hypothetical protein